MLTRDTILGQGVIIPLRRVGRDFVHAGGIDNIHSNIKQILSTQKGELEWNPDFGISLDSMRHQNIDDLLLAEMESDVLLALSRYEPRIEVLSIQPRQDASNPNRIFIAVYWRAIARNNIRSTVLTEEQSTEVLI